MTERKLEPIHAPARDGSLTAALALVQTRLPVVGKSETAEVKTKTGGTYKYSYADLAAVSKAILPLLGAAGLAWVTAPTVNAEGRMVLRYELRHVSGESIEGTYPLSGGTPQEIGSAITYARRYCLCSVTGVAPESDDDDAAAASHKRTDEWETAAPAPQPEQVKAFDKLAGELRTAKRAVDIGLIGQKVHDAKAKGGITPFQYEQLARKASARLAELDKAQPAGPEGGNP
jgi:ERF superfamily protein